MTNTTPEMKTTAVSPWFGGNRTQAALPGRILGELAWCGVPFVGGAPELPHIKTRSGVAGDLHRHQINLLRVIREPALAAELEQRLLQRVFHPDELRIAQELCKRIERETMLLTEERWAQRQPDVVWAEAYYVAVWMGRGGLAGTAGELDQTLSVRWSSKGGASGTRYRSAVESIKAWSAALARWEFAVIDAVDFLRKMRDEPGHGVYVDAPWPDLGDGYKHAPENRLHTSVAEILQGLGKTRVVVRYGVHPLIEKLYPRERWHWVETTTTNLAGNDVHEVLILNQVARDAAVAGGVLDESGKVKGGGA